MKQILRLWMGPVRQSRVVAFGQARLVRTPAGTYELHGGNAHERCAVREWISLFEHGISCGPGFGGRAWAAGASARTRDPAGPPGARVW